MSEWIQLSQKLPEDSQFVIANVVNEDKNYIYAEVLEYVHKQKVWKYNNGHVLESGLKVTAWKTIGSTWVGNF